jgi:hypothetical protein
MAEIELSVLKVQCLDDRIPEVADNASPCSCMGDSEKKY